MLVTYECAAPEPGLVLVVDDEALIALDIAAIVEESGHAVLGPAFNLPKAFALIEQKLPQFAVLDINVGKDAVWPLASHLKSQGVAIAFISGDPTQLAAHPEFDNCLRLHKPALPEQITGALARLELEAAARAAAALASSGTAPRRA